MDIVLQPPTTDRNTKTQLLLVEDSFTDASLLRQMFRRNSSKNWQISHVENLRDAIALCTTRSPANRNTFDVALLDLHLPDSAGIETVKQFRAMVPNLPVIVLTGVNDEDLALQALAVGAQDFLVKDHFSMQQIVRSIRYAIEREQVLRQIREQQQRIQQELLQEQTLKQVRADLVSVISHEVRTPLTLIRTAVDLLQRHDSSLFEGKRSNYFSWIQSAINQILNLTDDALLLSRASSGQLRCEPTFLNLEYLCHELTEAFQLGDATHEIHFVAQGDCTHAKIDEELLRCILTNLLSNAIKYSPPRSRIQLDLICENSIVTFRVQDQGMGIPEKDQAHLFEKFYRASNVGSIPGTGLGLAIVKQCADRHQGQIWIQSEVNVGTTVTVALPLNWEGVEKID